MPAACPVLDFVRSFPEEKMATLEALVAKQTGVLTATFYKMDQDDFDNFTHFSFDEVWPEDWLTVYVPELSNEEYGFYIVKCYCKIPSFVGKDLADHLYDGALIRVSHKAPTEDEENVAPDTDPEESQTHNDNFARLHVNDVE